MAGWFRVPSPWTPTGRGLGNPRPTLVFAITSANFNNSFGSYSWIFSCSLSLLFTGASLISAETSSEINISYLPETTSRKSCSVIYFFSRASSAKRKFQIVVSKYSFSFFMWLSLCFRYCLPLYYRLLILNVNRKTITLIKRKKTVNGLNSSTALTIFDGCSR